MKLRTELSTTRRGYISFGYDDESLRHDAMAAHALLRAINDTRDNPYLYGGTGGQPELVIEMIEQRAAEILAGWMGEDRG